MSESSSSLTHDNPRPPPCPGLAASAYPTSYPKAHKDWNKLEAEVKVRSASPFQTPTCSFC